MMVFHRLFLAFMLIGFTGPALPQEFPLPESPKTEIMVLGTYHMGNPGLDTFNVEADDILSERRQAEIRAVVAALAEFNPTMIAIESPHNSTVRIDKYQTYLDGDYELVRDEIDQIGFRLAKELGHETVYPVDYRWSMGAGLEDVDEEKFLADYAGINAAMNDMGLAYTKAQEEKLSTSTVGGQLRYLNSDSMLYANHYMYITFDMKMGQGDEFIGPSVVANWYKRNLLITHNLIRLAGSSGEERILVIIGQGHAYLLNQFLDESPFFERVDAADYLPD